MRSFIVISFVLAFLSCGSNKQTEEKQINLDNKDSKLSYSIGFSIGKNLTNDNVPIIVDALVKGLQDAINDTALLTIDEMEMALYEFQMQRMQQYAAPNEANGQQFMEKQLSENPNLKLTASGLIYEVIKEGKGKKPTIDNIVSVNYTGTLIDGTVFDSNKGKDPISFPLNGVIKGWQEGIPLMSVGAKYKFIIPPSLAYGNNPPPGTPILPGSVLIFEVELLGIE